ncbi:MAG: UDP-N-acetylmuramoyl-L-alanyl-D-glutamate--2,6-diaminopimelate ligase, partial [Chloroflexi bacterium]|nr:UDP-N-acetylmuramoyl-L-alanyl-D-glutamate--2,6-diaminopimelate ligase [Chloroflexota bacterium]
AALGYPARALRVIGVTGTDGKTTTVRLISAILAAAGRRVGRIDTISASIGEHELPTGFHTTTPDAPEVQAFLAQMVAANLQDAVVESTSHGLAQHRVTACEFDAAVVTNITREHLDYHGTFEAYRDAKALLFRALSHSARKPGVPKVAVYNADDPSYELLHALPADVQLCYALQRPADVTADQISSSPAGLHLCVRLPGGQMQIDSPLVGRYNAANILAAVTVAHALGVPPEAMAAGIGAMRGVAGRMQRIDCGQPFTVIVDFAHTPNALENALATVRRLTDGRVSVVFGCAGLRDHGKRPLMGEVAGRLADRTVITAEDPRTEPLDEIMEQIAEGCRAAGRLEGQGFWRVGDRGEAIAFALQQATPGDLVIITGKGPEPTMCLGTTEYPWSDEQAAIDVLAALGWPG